MEVNEHQSTIVKVAENQRKSMKMSINEWKVMKDNKNSNICLMISESNWKYVNINMN